MKFQIESFSSMQTPVIYRISFCKVKKKRLEWFKLLLVIAFLHQTQIYQGPKQSPQGLDRRIKMEEVEPNTACRRGSDAVSQVLELWQQALQEFFIFFLQNVREQKKTVTVAA